MRGPPSTPLTPDQAIQEAVQLHRGGKLPQAARLYEAVLKAAPQHFDAMHLLGLVRWQQKRPDEAFRRLRSALAIKPDDAGAYANLGSVLKESGQSDHALTSYRAAVTIKPDHVEAHSNLAITLAAMARREEAMASCRRALAIRPDYADPHSNLGDLLAQLGRPAQGIRAVRRALYLNPLLDRARRNLLSICLYDPSLKASERFAIHRRYGARPSPPPRQTRLRTLPEPGRIIRVGYLSSDFRGHPVGRNMLPIVRSHDRARVSTHLYSTVVVEDEITAQFRAVCPRFRSLAGRTEEAIADAVAEDRIDLLVILAAHFDENPIQVARLRPAPVIVSFHDAATSGLGEVDYLVSDGVMVPRVTEELFSERVVRVPSMYVYDPPTATPPARRPRIADAPLTFASLNNPAKVNDQVLSLWGRILAETPGSRLLLQYNERYQSPSLTESVLAALRPHGVTADRIQFLGAIADRSAHLDLYDRIDIALDCFPFNGATTTFELLWMGVPVVTLAGNAMVGRTSMSFLRRVGLDDLVAATPDAYVTIAARLAADGERLARLRRELGTRVAGSALRDGPKTARYLERTYRALWRRWCATRS